MNEQYAITCKGAMYTLHIPAEFNAAHPPATGGPPMYGCGKHFFPTGAQNDSGQALAVTPTEH
jgi:hypothetical protein